MPDDIAIAATHDIEIRDLEYRRDPSGPLLARLYQPKGPGPFPALIEVHGGAWAAGDRLNNAPLDEALAKSGIVVLAIDFRMPPQHRYPASIADIHYATRWLKAHAGEFGSRRDLVAGLGDFERRASIAAVGAEAERPALRRAAAGRGAAGGREPAVSGAVLADLRPAGALPHGQGKGQDAAHRVARRLLELRGRDGRGQPAADRRERRGGDPAAGDPACRAPATTTSPPTWPTGSSRRGAPRAARSSCTNSTASRTRS